MDARKNTPDILGDLLENTSIPASQHTSKPVKQQAVKPAGQKTRRPAERKPPSSRAQKASQRPVETRKEEQAASYIKATFYVSEQAAEALEQAWHTLRKAAPPADRGRISKSAIVQEAVLELVRELEEKGSKSRLARLFTPPSR